MELKNGNKAPAFELESMNGNKVSLNDMKGKWIVLYFYPRDNTSGCTLEAVGFTARSEDFKKLGAEIYGVSRDSVKSHRGFAEKHKLGIQLLSDPDLTAHKAYCAWGKKVMYGKETEGVIRSTFIIGPDLKLAHLWPKVTVKGHVEKVYEKLAELIKK